MLDADENISGANAGSEVAARSRPISTTNRRASCGKGGTVRKTALFSVFEKPGVEIIAQRLIALGWSILSSGGTAKYLREHGIQVSDISDLVGEPILGHRVVTLAREIYAGLLARDTDEDLRELERIKAPPIGLVYVELYPVMKAIESRDATYASVVEMTDIGGPTLLYAAAAKGGQLTAANRKQMEAILRQLEGGSLSDDDIMRYNVRTRLAVIRYQAMTMAFAAGFVGYDESAMYRSLDLGTLENFCALGSAARTRAEQLGG